MEFALWKAVLLGIIQGATEFLPVSSSGHLVIFQSIFGLEMGALTFDVFLHFGTLIAVVIIFWSDVKQIVLFKKSHRHLTYLLLLGIIPTGIIGVAFKDIFEELFHSVLLVGCMLIFTGLILWISETFQQGRKDLEGMKPVDAIFIGVMQGLAIIPGISRSGSTIAAGLTRGITREQAARYSFLVALPVIFGATLLEAKDIFTGAGGQVSIVNLFAGTLAAIISGYFAIRFLMKMLREKSLKPFAYYCWAVGAITILTQIF